MSPQLQSSSIACNVSTPEPYATTPSTSISTLSPYHKNFLNHISPPPYFPIRRRPILSLHPAPRTRCLRLAVKTIYARNSGDSRVPVIDALSLPLRSVNILASSRPTIRAYRSLMTLSLSFALFFSLSFSVCGGLAEALSRERVRK